MTKPHRKPTGNPSNAHPSRQPQPVQGEQLQPPHYPPLYDKDGVLIDYGSGDGITQNEIVAYGEEQDFCDL